MTRTRCLLLCAPLALASGCDDRGDSPLNPGTSNIDRTPPIVVSTLPSAGATQVSLVSPITVMFSEPMRSISISRATITFHPPIVGPVTIAGNTATVVPTAPLAATTVYVGTVTTDVEDAARNSLPSPFIWAFTTGVPSMTVP